MARIQFSLRMLLAAIAVVAVTLSLYRLGRVGAAISYTLVAFLVFIVGPIVIVGQRSPLWIAMVAALFVVCIGVLAFLVAAHAC